MEPQIPPEVIRWSASDPEADPSVIETRLLLPTRLYLALEQAARQHHMTVGQMTRVLIGRGLRHPDAPPAEGQP